MNKKRGKGRKCPSTEEADKENIPPKKKDKHVSVSSKRTTVRILPNSSNTTDNTIGVAAMVNNTEIAVNPLKENQSARILFGVGSGNMFTESAVDSIAFFQCKSIGHTSEWAL